MGPTRGPYILQVCMGPSYFWRGLTPPDPPLFRALLDLGCCKKIWFGARLLDVCYAEPL